MRERKLVGWGVVVAGGWEGEWDGDEKERKKKWERERERK